MPNDDTSYVVLTTKNLIGYITKKSVYQTMKLCLNNSSNSKWLFRLCKVLGKAQDGPESTLLTRFIIPAFLWILLKSCGWCLKLNLSSSCILRHQLRLNLFQSFPSRRLGQPAVQCCYLLPKCRYPASIVRASTNFT